MSISSPDSEKYLKSLADLAHLIKVFGGQEVLSDLYYFFPDEYEDLLKVLERGIKTKQLARLLDASQSRRCRIGVEDPCMAVERSDSLEGDK